VTDDQGISMLAENESGYVESVVHIPELPHLDVANQDVPLLVSYPKSGRTWLRYIFALAKKPLELTHAGCGSNVKVLGKSFEGIPSGLIDGGLCMFMHRNPIDTAISYYFQVTRKDFNLRRKIFHLPRLYLENRLPPKDIVEFLRHPGFGVEKICKFNRAWLDNLAGRENVLVFSFEDMKFRPEETLAKVMAFSRVSDCDIDWLVRQSDFARMKAAEKSGKARHLKLRQAKSGDPDSAKVRRGKVRGYREYLDETTIREFQDVCRNYGFEA
jgi:hypothetical protein